MKLFQYISDIHLETRPNLVNFHLLIPKLCNNLILLGDIGDPTSDIYNSFINNCTTRWKNIFVLYGNHEYYSKKSRKRDMEVLKLITFPPNVYLLDNHKKYIDDNDNVSDYPSSNSIKLLGTTLWSDIKPSAANSMNDYRRIYSNGSLITPDITISLFHKNKSWILSELSSEYIPTILLTHHGVHSICNGIYQGNDLESGFATDIPELSTFPHLKVCINGHTHVSLNTFIPNTNIRLLSNCYGYPGEDKSIVKYNSHSLLEID
jgi:predicted phosphodiesterase